MKNLKKNNLFNFEDLEDFNDDSDFSELTEDELLKNISTLPSVKLAEVIIANRYLNLYQELSLKAMEELGQRRIAGDSFQYEEYIETNMKDLPKIDFTFPQIASLLDQLKGFKK